MDSFPVNLLNQTQLYQTACPSAMEAPFKLDEGYSEETRSQEEDDSPLRMDTAAGEVLSLAVPPMTALSDGVLALSEAERSGKKLLTHRP